MLETETSSLRSVPMSSQSQFSAENNCTYMGLHKWYEHIVEKLGWVVVHNNKNKYEAYDNEMAAFIRIATNKATTIDSKDKKRDIDIMISQVTFLQGHSKKDAEESSRYMKKGGDWRKKSKSKNKSKSKEKKAARRKSKSKSMKRW